MNEIIEELVSKIKKRYLGMYVGFDYDELEDHYEIWYNDESLDRDEGFQLFIGELIYDYLLPRKIFNVSFYYNYEKSKALELDVYSNIKNIIIETTKRKTYMQTNGYQTNINNFSDDPNLFCLAA